MTRFAVNVPGRCALDAAVAHTGSIPRFPNQRRRWRQAIGWAASGCSPGACPAQPVNGPVRWQRCQAHSSVENCPAQWR